MRDRLIDLLTNSGVTADTETFEELADYLIKNGVIVPPCKVGDKLFRIIEVTSSTIKPFIPILRDEVEPYGIYYKNLFGGYSYIPFDEVGKSVFLTKEEAEKALKERESK